MYILLTDHLTCPRCGPDFGLILRADSMEDRRVLEGTLGCANCREQYPIRGGFADLRPRPAGPLEPPEEAPAPGGKEEALRLAGLMGVTEGPGFSLIVGREARLAPGVAELVDGLEVVAARADLAVWRERTGVDRMAVGPTLPLKTASMRAVALSGDAAAEHLREGSRVLSPVGRLVLEPAPDSVDERLESLGLEVAAQQEETVVATPA